MSDGELAVDVIDARNALGFVIFKQDEAGNVFADIKAMKVDARTAAGLCYQVAKALKAKAEKEEAEGEG